MSLFAGIYYHDRQRAVSEEARTHLKSSLNRGSENVVTEFVWPGAFLVHVDIGALGHLSYERNGHGGVILAAGEILSRPAGPTHRVAELQDMAASLAADDSQALRRARGTFCLATYAPDEHHLVLGVDAVGVRPLYYFDDGHRVVFSTALRIFEKPDRDASLTVDVQAIIELSTLGYPLGTRTPFREVRCLRGGETVSWQAGVRREHVYWRWDDVPEDRDSPDRSADRLHSAFMDAVKIRNGNKRHVRAFLSGGLDSRCVVTALSALELCVDTYNVSREHTYDQVIGAEYAKRVGATHHAIVVPENVRRGSGPTVIAEAVASDDRTSLGEAADRPRVFWSGDGGSVGLGRVYLTDSMVASLRDGQIEKAVEQFLACNRTAFPGGAFRHRVKRDLETRFIQDIREEMGRYRCQDPGKALLFFLLQNDQRRHMATFYEEIDQNRVEYELPFFDREFLAAATSLNLDATLYHRFYVRYWLGCFGADASSLFWQAYPSHEPCPLPAPDGAVPQWAERNATLSWGQRLQQLKTGLRWASGPSLPADLFSRWRLAVVGSLGLLLGTDYSYIYRVVDAIARCRAGDRQR